MKTRISLLLAAAFLASELLESTHASDALPSFSTLAGTAHRIDSATDP